MTALTAAVLLAVAADPLPGFRKSAHFGELTRETWVEGDARAVVLAPGDYDPKRPTRLIVFATPNGNSVEWTLGCAAAPGLDWHYDIQHVAAQVRRYRELTPGTNVVVACVEAEGFSFPAWKKSHANGPARCLRVVEWARNLLPGGDAKVTLTCHSGGGSFVTGVIDAADAIPAFIDRISYLDANYSYDDAAKHGDKLLAWLNGDASRRLCVIAYDDRNITLNGKLVVGPTGGTFRATQRMLARFEKDVKFVESRDGEFTTRVALDGRLALRVHGNPKNAILHTALVGDMNGLLQALTEGDAPRADWGTFGGPRAYTKWVQPSSGIPPRPADAVGGAAFMKSVEELPRDAREEAIAAELLRGNLPEFLRKFVPLTLTADKHTAQVEVMSDYLAVGSDADFVRVPINPLTAQRVADAFGCALPTRKVVDAAYREAAVKLEPRPLTEAREAVTTFVRHHGIIEGQRAGRELGLLVAGIKKDVIVTNRLEERANRVAIYGWHKLDGVPIQPVNVSHVDWYVDYSHGVRLMKRAVTVDGKVRDARHVLHASTLR